MSTTGGHDGPVTPGPGPTQPAPSWTVHSPYGSSPAPPPPERRRSRRKVWTAVVASLVVLAMVLATGAALFSTIDTSDGRSPTPVNGFLDRVEQSESVMKMFQAGMESATSSRDLTEIAKNASRSLTRERARVAALDLSDHGVTLERAQEDYLGHVDAWLTAMESVSRGEEIDNGPQIDRTFQDACDAMRDAARAEGGNRDYARVMLICSPPEITADDDGSGTLQV